MGDVCNNDIPLAYVWKARGLREVHRLTIILPETRLEQRLVFSSGVSRHS